MKMNDQDCIAIMESWPARFNETIHCKPNDKVNSNLADLSPVDNYWRGALALTGACRP